MEIWKDVKEYEGLYQISNKGKVKSMERVILYKNKKSGGKRKVKEILLKQRKDKDGYFIVDLQNDGIVKTKKVHRLVAEAFLLNQEGFPVVHHKNEIKSDNRVDNLKFCTVKYNTRYSLSKPIIGINEKTKELIYFDGLRESEKHGFRSSHISACCNGKISSHKGYVWSFYEGDAAIVL